MLKKIIWSYLNKFRQIHLNSLNRINSSYKYLKKINADVYIYIYIYM